MNWIPTSERLPEAGEREFVLIRCFIGDDEYYRTIQRYDGKWLSNLARDIDIRSPWITHWLPITAPDAGAGRGGEG